MILKIFYSFLALFWAFFIFFLSSIPGSQIPQATTSYEEIIAHFYLYLMLSFLIYFSIFQFNKNKLSIIFWWSVIIASLYGITDEWHQHFVPGRFATVSDWSIDFFGLVVGAYGAISWQRLKKPRLLLHICCVGCGVYISQILSDRYRVVLYFDNPNIFPVDEYKLRLAETKKIAREYNLKLIVNSYDHDKWLKEIRGYESEPERGKRCDICFKYRLGRTAEMAKKLRIKNFTTTLSISPHKDAQKLIKIGQDLAFKYNLIFLGDDFKKKDGFKKSGELAKKLNLYRQNYCGCEFSIRSK